MKGLYGSRLGTICALFAFLVLPSVAGAEEWRRGTAPVDATDTLRRTITIDEIVYAVPTTCRIRRESGVPLRLSDLRVSIRRDQPLVPVHEVDFVRFEAMEKSGGWEMVEIIVLDGPLE